MSNKGNVVTRYLIHGVQQQLQQHHSVVWFDPEKQYFSVARAENFPEARFCAYDPRQGFLVLRRQLEEVWGAIEPPQLLIYVPLAEEASHHALIEYTTAGVTLQPGQQPLECNTRLAVVARHALEGILPATHLAKVLSEVENGQLSLAELDQIADQHREIHIGALALIFKSENAEEICLQFLTSPRYDEDIRAKHASATLIALLQDELEVRLSEGDAPSKVRDSLARHLLLTEFVTPLGKSFPPALSTFDAPKSPAARETALRLVREWRLRNDCTAGYVDAAQRIEPELGLAKYAWSLEALESLETFAGVDAILQTLIETALLDKPVPALVELAKRRQTSFWPHQLPTLKLHWQMIVEAGQLLLQAAGIRAALKQEGPAASLVKNYADAHSPWCKLDTTFRRLERDEHNFDFETEQHDALQKLLAAARSTYAEVVHTMTERFISAYEKAGFHLPEIVPQSAVYRDFVQPALEAGKTAYFLVDAFRYEMALDLFEQLQADWDCRIVPALATSPTITEVGMAALMPDAEKGLSLTSAGGGKLSVMLQKTTLKNRADRVKYLGERCPQSVVLELNQIVPLKDKKVIASLANARLAVITATDEIDGLWESQPETARRLHDDVFNQLRRGIRNLWHAGYATLVVTSDHGFIAGDNLMAGTPMDTPGGETADLHRRVWIGRGGAGLAGCLRKSLSAFGLGGNLELVTPKGLGCFKVAGGSTQYYHGGLSLQELVIPVLSIRHGKNEVAMAEPDFHWKVTLGSSRLTTRFFSVTVSGSAAGFLALSPRIRVELRAGEQVLSTTVAATYGLDETTKDVKMKIEEGSTTLVPNTIMLLIAEIPSGITSLELDLINAETGLALVNFSDIPIAIAL